MEFQDLEILYSRIFQIFLIFVAIFKAQKWYKLEILEYFEAVLKMEPIRIPWLILFGNPHWYENCFFPTHPPPGGNTKNIWNDYVYRISRS